jgi:tRNA acetyltransferase TAN1
LLCGAGEILTAAYSRQNVIGMSVVGPDYEKLKRFNLEELRQPISSAASGAMEDTNKVTEGQKDE